MQTPAQPDAAGSGRGGGSVSTERSHLGGAPQRTRRRGRGRWLLLGLLGLLAVLALLYAAAFAYQFVETQLGPFAPLAAVLVLGLLVALVGPVVLVRERMPLEAAVRASGHWLWMRLQTSDLPQRFAARSPPLARFVQDRGAQTPTRLTRTLRLVAARALARTGARCWWAVLPRWWCWRLASRASISACGIPATCWPAGPLGPSG